MRSVIISVVVLTAIFSCSTVMAASKAPLAPRPVVASTSSSATGAAAAPDPTAFVTSLIAPGVALLVGLINLIWNFTNFLATKNISKKAQRSARKMAALNPFRMDAMKCLKELQSHTAELVSIPRAASYQAICKPVQGRFISSSRNLRDIMLMMSLDPEIDGNDWGECFDNNYDRFLDCSNTLLSSQTTDAEHSTAKQRLVEIAKKIHTDVLARFSLAIDSAQN